MVKDAQVRVLRRKLMEGKTQESAAAGAGMSVGSARKWRAGQYPTQARKRHWWRNRPDPFAEVFESDVVALLAADEKRVLEARTILGELNRHHPGSFSACRLRTLQRRIRQWRALNGPDKEVFFPPGTCARTRSGLRLHQLRRTRCDNQWRTVRASALLAGVGLQWLTVALSESYEALLLGVQEALWRLGGVVEVLRSVGRDA